MKNKIEERPQQILPLPNGYNLSKPTKVRKFFEVCNGFK